MSSAVYMRHAVKRGDLSSSQPSSGCTWTTLLCWCSIASSKQVNMSTAGWFLVTWPHQPLTVLWLFYRLIMCYNDTKQSVKLAATPSCLQEVNRLFLFYNMSVVFYMTFTSLNQNTILNFQDGYLCELETFENHCSLASVEPQLNVTQTADRRWAFFILNNKKILVYMPVIASVKDGHM